MAAAATPGTKCEGAAIILHTEHKTRALAVPNKHNAGAHGVLRRASCGALKYTSPTHVCDRSHTGPGASKAKSWGAEGRAGGMYCIQDSKYSQKKPRQQTPSPEAVAEQ